MSDIKNVLRENIENFDEQYQMIEKSIVLNGEHKKMKTAYVAALGDPIKPQQILLWGKSGKGERIKEDDIYRIYEELYQRYGQEYQFCWVLGRREKVTTEMEADFPGVFFVTVDTEEFYKELAASKYLIRNAAMPFYFIKREGQCYINTFSEEQASEDTESLFRLEKERKKTDLCNVEQESFDAVLRFFEPKTAMIGTGGKKEKAALKKKLLVMVNWREMAEDKAMAEWLLGKIDKKEYEISVMARGSGREDLNREFLHLDEEAHKILYRGAMTLSKEELILLRLIRENPDVYVKSHEVRVFVDVLMEREWRRTIGAERFDRIIVLGKHSIHMIFWVYAMKDAKKTLIDDGIMESLQKGNEETWQRLLAGFDRIVAPFDCENKEIYGEINHNKVSYFPMECQDYYRKENNKEQFVFAGEKYFMAGCWETENGRKERWLIEEPEQGSILIRAQLPSDDARISNRLQQLSPKGKRYVFGKYAQSYKDVFGENAVLLSMKTIKQLLLFRGAGIFFEKLSDYYYFGESDYDFGEKLSKNWGIIAHTFC